MEELLAALHHEQQQAARHRGDAVRNATTLRWNPYIGMTTQGATQKFHSATTGLTPAPSTSA